ncbi:hypothetical protein [Massilia antarctica]|uniref:hypothetical protein n=1 Tax=Massilia antarctica TaxID=2765360 RepID=UPI0006BB7E46|nr:hypothetical protein [Massilia sp. H27-R4]MCY0913379.1 hypothetical protein [Massilia sp. H27-R4]CUI09510.1 hypothetical protein BN2497_13797 [Janthinobacterium sp. CG23_2]CUU33296.1 hypothetical protein BN3177_13797 [Janthinobacterium sp. CG23_2]
MDGGSGARRLSARQRVAAQPLTRALLLKALSAHFPKKNDYHESETGYAEEIGELQHFSVDSVGRLGALLGRHRKRILAIDRSPMDQWHQNMYREEMGTAVFADFLRRQFWFAYPGLLRLALELEFGERYETFANQRDGTDHPAAIDGTR